MNKINPPMATTANPQPTPTTGHNHLSRLLSEWEVGVGEWVTVGVGLEVVGAFTGQEIIYMKNNIVKKRNWEA